MGRKQIVDGGKKNEIIKIALELFLEKGYDGTTIRMIQKAVKSEIGLFYYYFKNKDELFDYVLDLFFENYKKDFQMIIDHGRRNPCRIMTDFFEYIECKTEEFREKYKKNIHRTMQWAIRERTLDIIEPFIQEVVKIQSAYYGVKTPIDEKVVGVYLTHGVGSAILHESKEKYYATRGDVVKGVSMLMGMPIDEQTLRIPFLANIDDLDSLLELFMNQKNGELDSDFSKLKGEFESYISDKAIYVIRDNKKVVGAICFSFSDMRIDYLVVDSQYRRKGIGKRLLETALAQFPRDLEIDFSKEITNLFSNNELHCFFEAQGMIRKDINERDSKYILITK